MEIVTNSDFKFEISENCYIYLEDDFESCEVLDRRRIDNINYYYVDVIWKWQNEAFLRKQ